MKQVRFWALAAAVLLLPALSPAYEVPKDLVIKRPEKNEPINAWVTPVNFPHGKHAVHNACQNCHHEESDRNLGEFLKCTQCHNKPGTEDTKGFFLAWHSDATMSCLGCHRKMRLKDPKLMPPLSCTRGCHKKEEGRK